MHYAHERDSSSRNGGPEVLQLDDVAEPIARPGRAADRRRGHRRQLHRDLPARRVSTRSRGRSRLGAEAAGVVRAIGDGVSGFQGRRSRRVTECERRVRRARDRARGQGRAHSRRRVDQDGRRGLAARADRALPHALDVPARERAISCLVHAAAGGVGLLLCQMAKKRGACVIGTASTEEKRALRTQRRRRRGDRLHARQDFAAATKRLTNGAGVNVVYDSVGKTTFDKSLDCLRPRGMHGRSSASRAARCRRSIHRFSIERARSS